MDISQLIKRLKWRFSLSWRFFAAFLIPIFLLPIIFIHDDEIIDVDTNRMSTKYRTLYVVILMSAYWALEILPLPITALLPLVLIPLLSIQNAYTVSQNYTKESNMIFLGGVIIALGVEYCGLHHRIALRVMTLVGASPIQLMGGAMAVVSILSMWISSTTCVTMLVPVVIALIDEIHESPEVMSDSEIRRRSSAGIFDDTGLNNGRRFSAASTCSNNEDRFVPSQRIRQMSSVFTNVALSRTPSPSHSHSTTYSRHLVSPSHSLSPIIELQRDRHSNHLEVPGSPPVSIIIEELGTESDSVFEEDLLKKKHVGFSNETDPVDNNSLCSSKLDNVNNNADSILKEMWDTEERKSNIKKMFLFAMAYAANIGGTAVITGTSPNKVFKEVIKPLDISQGGEYRNMTFFVWMALNVPPMLVNILIAWAYLAIVYYGIPNWRQWFWIPKIIPRIKLPTSDVKNLYKWRTEGVKIFLRKEYNKLGRISFHEIAVGIIFMGVVLLWMLRTPEWFDGWSSITSGGTGDSTPAMLGVVILFIFPKDWSFLFGSEKDDCKYEALLDWKFCATKIPWGVLLLLGSGFALADASEYSGLSNWIGQELILLGDLPKPLLLLVVIVITSIITEVVSSIACANILIKIVVAVSRSLELHPLYLTVPVTLTCSYAFLFPIATPTNTIAGTFSTMEMVKTGLILNLICIAVLYLNTIYFGDWLFDYNNYKYAPTESEELIISEEMIN